MPPSHPHLAAARARAMPYSCSCISQGTWSPYANNNASDYHRILPEMSIVNVKPLEDPFGSHLTPDYHPSTSNPSTPYQQNELNSTNEFGVPYHHGQPSSVNSLTDALCPNGDTNDRQVTPTSPVGGIRTPECTSSTFVSLQSLSSARVTGTRSRLTTEQNIDDLTAFLQDPNNTYLTDDLTSVREEDEQPRSIAVSRL